jgi:PKD repeat protein
LPNPPATFTATWSKVSGPGTVTFGNASNPVTTATFSTAGTYDLRLTANDSALSSNDDLIVTVNATPPVNHAPTVNAGPDQTITLPAAASLNGTVTDDGLPNPPAAVTTTWSKVSGPGTVTFGNPAAKSTTATFSTSGAYVLQLTASDSALSGSDTIAVTVNPAPTNKAPTVSAGPDLTITLPATASLNGTASDDGLPNPPGALTVTWSKVSGPGTVTFANPSARVTTATFSTAGTYVVQLTASDSALSASDQAQVTVNAASGGSGPCANLCSNPVNFTINSSFQSGNIGTGAVCYQTTSVVHGGNCGNFVSPRTLQVNGTTESCVGGNWASVPAARNGGYCIQTTSGNQPWAFFTAF